MKQRRSHLLFALPLGLLLFSPALAAAAAATRDLTLEDYKYFRALSIDLQGRVPTRDELTAFEQSDFDLQQWIDGRLQGDDYVDRLTRIYSDLLRPQINGFRLNNFSRAGLSMVTFRGPDGKLTRLYFRPSQVRARVLATKTTLNADTNYKACVAIKDPVHDPQYVTLNCAQYEKWDNLVKANMCLTADELGIRYNGSSNFGPTPFPALAGDVATTPPRANAVQTALDTYSKVVKPWWLYSDFAAGTPVARYDASWAQQFPGYVLNNTLLKEPDNTTDTMTVRVCNEEALAAPVGAVDGKKNPDGTPLIASCLTGYGAASSSGCGCGPGLSWCLPAGTYNTTFPGSTFTSSRNVLLGVDDPTDQVAFTPFDWQSLWMSQEPVAFFNRLFGEDRDFREVVTGRWTMVNGPLAQFYRMAARTSTLDADLGQSPLPTDSNLPATLPMDVNTWTAVEDRGPNAAGILTQAWFDMKFSTQRARAHSIYNAFVCRDFVAPPGLTLSASPEPDLSKRSGCAVCHHVLEPLSAYFSHTGEGDWTWLDAKTYPTQNPACKQTGTPGKIPSACATRYDNVFSTADFGMLRGAYSSPEHSDQGPAGLGQYLTGLPEFSACTTQNVAQSFLGRDLRAEDAALKQQLSDSFAAGGYKIRPLVKAILNSTAYKSANNWNSTVWRSEGK